MYRLSITLLFLLFHLNGFSQDAENADFEVYIKKKNPTPVINDGQINLEVIGGAAPYTYQWSNKETPQSALHASGLTEGIPYTVKISDANGQTITKIVEVPAESITEHFNSWMKPIVNTMAQILFWDLFEAVDLYDPKVYIDHKEVTIPNWNAKTNKKFSLKQWLKEEGSHVEKGQQIAVVSKEGSADIEIYAPNAGTLHYLVNEGDVVFDPQNKDDVIEQGAHHVAKLTFDTPIPLLYPNGTQQKNSIPFIVIWLILGSIFFTFKLGFVNIWGF